MENKKYIKPEIQVIEFEETDVIATSWAEIVNTYGTTLDEYIDVYSNS